MRRRMPKIGLFLTLTAALGCNAQDADRLKKVAGHVAARLDIITDHAPEKAGTSWDAVRGCWAESALDGRVHTRLRWEKTLAELDLKVQSNKTNDIRLRGTIHDETQHQRILDVTRATLGVNQIVDELILDGAPSSAPVSAQ